MAEATPPWKSKQWSRADAFRLALGGDMIYVFLQRINVEIECIERNAFFIEMLRARWSRQ